MKGQIVNMDMFQKTLCNLFLIVIVVANYQNPKGIKYETRLQLDLSHLREHKFKHSFQDILNPFCDCSCQIETTVDFLYPCLQFSIEKSTLLNKIKSTDTCMLDQSDSNLNKSLVFGGPHDNTTINTLIINAIIGSVLNTKRFDMPLF